MRAWLLLVLLVSLALLAWQRGVRLPDRYNPWAPLDVADAPNVLTRYKLSRLREHPRQCRAVLAHSEAAFTPVPDHVGHDGCGWHDAVRLRGTGGAALHRPSVVSCPLAVSMALFDRHVLQPEARARFGVPVTRIESLGSYACRPVAGRAQAPLSRHATAQAIDVASFSLSDGRRISVARDWGVGARGAFLDAVQRDGCGVFGMILGPRYNAAHRDHFHLQDTGGGWCR